MERKNRLSDLMPEGSTIVDGEYDIRGAFALRRMKAEPVGDLVRHEYLLETEYGHARYAVLGREHYYVDWGTYAFKGGLAYAATIEQPFVELHFQVRGAIRSPRNGFGLDVDLRAGDNHLVFMPVGRGQFELTEDSEGAVVEILMSPDYFAGLGERYPHLFGAFLEKMLRQEAFSLSPAPLHTTPAMHAVLQRIRHRQAGHTAGSLFLEAQILELLALQVDQLDRPARRNGRALSRTDVDKMHAARELLLARVADPPSLADLARHVGTNEYKLKRGFKDLFGTSPYAFLLDHRLEDARACLLDTDLSIAEIAYRAGYRDPAHFTNAFRKKYGHPPSYLR